MSKHEEHVMERLDNYMMVRETMVQMAEGMNDEGVGTYVLLGFRGDIGVEGQIIERGTLPPILMSTGHAADFAQEIIQAIVGMGHTVHSEECDACEGSRRGKGFPAKCQACEEGMIHNAGLGAGVVWYCDTCENPTL